MDGGDKKPNKFIRFFKKIWFVKRKDRAASGSRPASPDRPSSAPRAGSLPRPLSIPRPRTAAGSGSTGPTVFLHTPVPIPDRPASVAHALVDAAVCNADSPAAAATTAAAAATTDPARPAGRPLPSILNAGIAASKFIYNNQNITTAKENERIFNMLEAQEPRVGKSLSAAKIWHAPSHLIRKFGYGAPEDYQSCSVSVVPMDTLDCAHDLYLEGKEVAVLNMCSDTVPGGGYQAGGEAQEESLCRRSTLRYIIRDQGFYPLPHNTAIYSPDVCVFRKSDAVGNVILNQPQLWWTNVISAAALRQPLVFQDDYLRADDREDMKERIRLVLRVAGHEGQKVLVLGAWGAGVFGHPMEPVALCFRKVFQEPEFAGYFQEIYFAILPGAESTFAAFQRYLNQVVF